MPTALPGLTAWDDPVPDFRLKLSASLPPIGNLATVVSHPGPVPLLLLIYPGWLAAAGILLPVVLRWPALKREPLARFDRGHLAGFNAIM